MKLPRSLDSLNCGIALGSEYALRASIDKKIIALASKESVYILDIELQPRGGNRVHDVVTRLEDVPISRAPLIWEGNVS